MSTSTPRILLASTLTPDSMKYINTLNRVHIEQPSEKSPMPTEELMERIEGVTGLIVTSNTAVTDELLAKAGPSLKVVSTVSVGYDHVDVRACKSRGIRLGYTPDVLTDATADTAAVLTMMAARHFGAALESVKNGTWGAWKVDQGLGMQLTNKTIGIFGLGRIGCATAKRLRAFGASRIIYHNRGVSPFAEELQASRVEFDDLLAQSDVLIIAAPMRPENKHLFAADAFRRMRSHAVFVNIARGGFVNQDDLYHALANGIIGAAGLDVTDPEPIDPNHPLVRQPNCVILPHVGSATVETRTAMGHLAIDNAVSGALGEAMRAELHLG